MTESNVKAICTTDDPIDDLKWHKLLAADPTMTAKVLPSFRPDKAVNCDKPGFAEYIGKLSEVVGYPITCPADVKKALLDRIDYFHDAGCVVADHGMDFAVYGDPDEAACARAFAAGMAGEKPAKADADSYKTMLLIACAKAYTEKNMVMQIHFGCLRDNNKPMWRALGPDTGFDAVNSQSGVECLGALLNGFVENEGLPKVILYSLSPADNTAIVTVMQCFQGNGVAGKIQHGSAWWFNDSRPGMRKQMEDLAANGVLGQFIGMLTDSRSFLSYTRHEYFRRILCELVGEWVEAGMYPNDKDTLESFISDLCFYNTKQYFNFNV